MIFAARAEEGGAQHGRCYKEKAPEDSPPLFQSGNVVFQAHHVGWIVSAFFATVATVTSAWLIRKHLRWYTNKHEQRYIVRILFMVPIYAWVSFASYLFWNHATPLLLLRDMYESTVLTSFFYLLLLYLSPHPDGQRDILRKDGLSRERDRRGITPIRKWVFPLGWVKWKPADGLWFFQLMKLCILQYCVLRPLTTFAAIVLDYIGLYCETSYSPAWGHIYILVIVSISVTIAMYALIQLYVCVKEQLAPKQPLLKLFSIKAVVFLTFWQASALGALSMIGLVKDTRYMTAEDINIGFGALLETFEMMIFGFVHIKAFSYRSYVTTIPTSPYDPRGFRALMHAFDFRETWRELAIGTQYLFHKARGREPEVDRVARRAGVLEAALGVERNWVHATPRGPGKDGALNVRVDTDVEEVRDDRGNRLWLPLRHSRQEKSEGLEEGIERELRRKGYTMRGWDTTSNHLEVPHYRRQNRSSWWRRFYDRLSHTSADDETLDHLASTRVKSRLTTSPPDRHESSMPLTPEDYDHDPPPPSLIRSFRKCDYRDVASPSSYVPANTHSYRNLTTPKPNNIRDLPGPAYQQSPTPNPPYTGASILATDRNLPSTGIYLRQDGMVSPQHLVATNEDIAVNVRRSDSVLGRLFVPTDAGHSFMTGVESMTIPTDGASDSHTYHRAHPTAAPGLGLAYPNQPPRHDPVHTRPIQGAILRSQAWPDGHYKRLPDMPISSAPRRLPQQIVLPAPLGDGTQPRRMHGRATPLVVPEMLAASASVNHLANQRMELPRQC